MACGSRSLRPLLKIGPGPHASAGLAEVFARPSGKQPRVWLRSGPA
jgi:hypothetical protein